MQAKVIAAAVLAASAACAHAADWNFSYTGFYHQEAATWLPDRIITGRFSGEDSNHDGVISLGELTALDVFGQDYFDGCQSMNDYYNRCELYALSYKPTGQLEISASEWGTDEAFSGWGGGITTGSSAYSYTYGMFGDYRTTLLWTGATAFAITPAPLPVPEPSEATLLIMGLLTLAGYRRSRKPKE